MSDDKKFFANFAKDMERIVKMLKNSSNDWNARYKALEDLEKFIQNGTVFEGFFNKFKQYQDELCEGLEKSVLDLRSELVRQACVSISVMATELGLNFKKMAHKLMKCLLDVAGSRNTVIRGYGVKCLPTVLQNCHSKNILFMVLDALNNTKSSMTMEACAEALRVILAFWPLSKEYVEYADVLQESITACLTSSSQETRALGAKCFWLFAGQLPDKRDKFLGSLDVRTRRMVEKGKLPEEDDKEYEAATKISAVLKGHIARKKYRDSMSFAKNVTVGQRVFVDIEAAPAKKGLFGFGKAKAPVRPEGIVRWVGELPGKIDKMVGLETDQPADGQTDGTFDGKKYFDCKPKCGLFVRAFDVKPDAAELLSGGAPAAKPATPAPVVPAAVAAAKASNVASPRPNSATPVLPPKPAAPASAPPRKTVVDRPSSGTASPAVAPKGVVAAAVAARNKAEEDDEPVLVPITKNFSFKRRSTSFWEDSDNAAQDLKQPAAASTSAAVNAAVAKTGLRAPSDDESRGRKLTATPLIDIEPGGPSQATQQLLGLGPSQRQKAMEQAGAPAGLQTRRSTIHRRNLSAAAAIERDTLLKEHQFHMATMGDIFQKEMDLIEVAKKDPNDPAYVPTMIEILGRLAQCSSVLKNKFLDFQRRVQTDPSYAMDDDDFLREMDAFK